MSQADSFRKWLHWIDISRMSYPGLNIDWHRQTRFLFPCDALHHVWTLLSSTCDPSSVCVMSSLPLLSETPRQLDHLFLDMSLQNYKLNKLLSYVLKWFVSSVFYSDNIVTRHKRLFYIYDNKCKTYERKFDIYMRIT